MSIDCRPLAFVLGLILLLPATAMTAGEPVSRVLRVGLQHALKTPSAAIAFAPEANDKSAPGFLVVSHNRFVSEGGPGTFVRNHRPWRRS